MNILNRMRFISSIILLCIGLSVLSPVTGINSYPDSNRKSSIVTLDICKKAGISPGFSPDMPLLYERSCTMGLSGPVCFCEPVHFTSKPFLIAFKEERPPRA